MYNGSNVFIPNHAFSTYTVSMLVANSERKIVFSPLNPRDNIAKNRERIIKCLFGNSGLSFQGDRRSLPFFFLSSF